MASQPTNRPNRVVQASEAKTHLLRILDDVERGETVTITRRGRTIAYITPELQEETYAERARRAIADILEIRKHVKPISIEQILADRNKGRK
jgi:prevent-host-death family protein